MTENAVSKRLSIGGAQFGLDYGVSNTLGKISGAQSARILSAAHAAGVDMIDLAPAYGDAEQMVAQSRPKGVCFRVVSKTKIGAQSLDEVEAQARRSARLAGGRLDTLLVHHASVLRSDQAEPLWSLLGRLKAEGLTDRIGFSAYAEDNPLELALQYRPEVIQAPLSFLDQRLINSGALAACKELGAEIHVRSIYLQGLIFLEPEALPPKLRALGPRLAEIRRTLRDADVAIPRAAVGFALGRPEVDRVIIGVASADELLGAIAAAKARPPDLDWASLRLDADWALSPVNWK